MSLDFFNRHLGFFENIMQVPGSQGFFVFTIGMALKMLHYAIKMFGVGTVITVSLPAVNRDSSLC